VKLLQPEKYKLRVRKLKRILLGNLLLCRHLLDVMSMFILREEEPWRIETDVFSGQSGHVGNFVDTRRSSAFLGGVNLGQKTMARSQQLKHVGFMDEILSC